MPKKKCCSDKPACKRCPLVMMKKGKLPPGYTVKKRKLVKIEDLDKKSKPQTKITQTKITQTKIAKTKIAA